MKFVGGTTIFVNPHIWIATTQKTSFDSQKCLLTMRRKTSDLPRRDPELSETQLLIPNTKRRFENGATVGKVQVQWGMFIYFKLDDLCRYWKLCIFIICSWIWTVVTFHIYNKYISSIYIKISYVINAISIFYGCNVTSKGSDIFCKFLVVLPTFWAFWCETHIFNASCATFFLVPSRMPSPQVKLNKDNFYEFCPPCNYLV